MRVSETTPPPPNPNGDTYERGVDPWHVSGAPDEVKDSPAWHCGPRQTGWYVLDWCKNVIGFIPDGTEFPDGASNG